MTHTIVMSKIGTTVQVSISISCALRLTASLGKALLPHLPSTPENKQHCIEADVISQFQPHWNYYNMHQTGAHWQQTGSVRPVEPMEIVPSPARSVTTQDQVAVLESPGCIPQAHLVLPTLWIRATAWTKQTHLFYTHVLAAHPVCGFAAIQTLI